jgi:hypothetical protein
MPENLRAMLAEMDSRIAAGPQGIGALSEADLARWRATLAAALERLDKVERASQAALDAYLVRPTTSARPASPSAGSPVGARQKPILRLANAMAALERELAAASGEEATPATLDSSPGPGA